MATLAETSLSTTEQRVLGRLVSALRVELGDELLAVWLYGSRARGEQPRDADSDVDLMVVTRAGGRVAGLVRAAIDAAAEAEGANPWAFAPFTYDAGELADRRAIESFFIHEVERDRVVLYGDGLEGEIPQPEPVPERGMRRRSRELMDQAYENLESSRVIIERGLFAPSISTSYYAMVNAARAALSEEDRHSRTHEGLWHLLREVHVAEGKLPADLVRCAQKAQHLRWYADYGGRKFTRETAQTVFVHAERLLRLVEALYE